MTHSTLLNGAATASIVMDGAIPTDTPKSGGTIRVLADNLKYLSVPYTSYVGSTFTLGTPFDFSGDISTGTGTAKNAFVSYMDVATAGTSESVTVVYDVDRALVLRVRDGGGTPIKEFIAQALISSTGGSINAIRTTDA